MQFAKKQVVSERLARETRSALGAEAMPTRIAADASVDSGEKPLLLSMVMGVDKAPRSMRWAPLRAKLVRLDALTAGDFGVVARQAHMRLDEMTAEEVVAALEIELQLRSPMRGRAMGFV